MTTEQISYVEGLVKDEKKTHVKTRKSKSKGGKSKRKTLKKKKPFFIF